MIWKALQNVEIHRPLIFFMFMGFIVPNYDNVWYYFMLNTCNISIAEYSVLNILPYVGIVIGTIIYLKYLKNVEVWKLIVLSLVLRMIMTIV